MNDLQRLIKCAQCIDDRKAYTDVENKYCTGNMLEFDHHEEVDLVMSASDCISKYYNRSVTAHEWIAITIGSCFGIFMILVVGILLFLLCKEKKIKQKLAQQLKDNSSSELFEGTRYHPLEQTVSALSKI